jgi:hypothetical protein
VFILPMLCDRLTISPERIARGDWDEAVMLELAHKHPRTGKLTRSRRAVRIAREQPYDLQVGARASVVCWGVLGRADQGDPGAVQAQRGARCVAMVIQFRIFLVSPP